MSFASKLWLRSNSIIPGGNGLLSKRPERYAPDIWPTYFKKSSGVKVVDISDANFIDMAQMGIGSAILGYSHKELTDAICEATASGVNCTLNCPEELFLAEKLIELNPFAGGVKFARGGGEAMSLAVRIARAATGKTKVAFSGYHGWCDWYLAANIGDNNQLNDHLLPGLDPLGIPKELKNTSIPFIYNDLKSFKKVIDENQDIGVICIEGARYEFPDEKFLEEIMKISEQKGIVIISDEITSGWRMTDGGVYKINGFKPHIVVYGKALGGGFAISAVVGTSEVMKNAKKIFASSTMWTEKIGFVAGLKTIEILTREKGWNHLIRIGDKIGSNWLKLASKYNLDLSITSFKPLITFNLNYGVMNDALKTLFTQEMLKRGYLASSSVYVSLAHTDEIVDEYLENCEKVFKFLSEAIDRNKVKDLLETSIRFDSFTRLTK